MLDPRSFGRPLSRESLDDCSIWKKGFGVGSLSSRGSALNINGQRVHASRLRSLGTRRCSANANLYLQAFMARGGVPRRTPGRSAARLSVGID